MFLLGLLGTGHCVGMCGPLVLALPSSTGRVLPQVIYHAGRVVTYCAVGASVGGVGQMVLMLSGGDDTLALERIARMQVGFSVLAALMLLVFALVRLGLAREPAWLSTASPTSVPGFGRIASGLVRSRSLPAVFFLGLIMGLLPCGLSWAAFSRVLDTGHAGVAAIMVLAFGIGTVPGLLLLGTAASRVARRYRKISDVLAGMLLSGMALHLGVEALVTIA